jgi:hypothetical protein
MDDDDRFVFGIWSVMSLLWALLIRAGLSWEVAADVAGVTVGGCGLVWEFWKKPISTRAKAIAWRCWRTVLVTGCRIWRRA